ncbi:MAG: hypothetical protein A3B38_02500 [Candidatus Levybacteria bacterium RIFCSPLOWO2_01_FULL_36_13]|nr:MAG: hypothetical protein A2684_03695 [Candidatus Levybacteria bacterium RIFCSPHIGHO2_01_FULL_36_15b]OGH35154.1 MAG: hypothetical protein A3B38_02500 [Candidatus Levybacteria bacterium RIFCSPLOWO2_01_FULL_36_13]
MSEPKTDDIMRAPDVADLDPYNQRGKPKQEAARELLPETPEEKDSREINREKEPFRILVLGSVSSRSVVLRKWIFDLLSDLGAKQQQVAVQNEADSYLSNFYNVENYTTSKKEDRSLPTGVVLLPEMHTYSEAMTGMNFSTYNSPFATGVEILCEENNVPLFEIREKIISDEDEYRVKAEEILKAFNIT